MTSEKTPKKAGRDQARCRSEDTGEASKAASGRRGFGRAIVRSAISPTAAFEIGRIGIARCIATLTLGPCTALLGCERRLDRSRAGRLARVVLVSAALATQCNPMGRLSYIHPSRSKQDLAKDEEACRQHARSAIDRADDYVDNDTRTSERLLRADLRRDIFDDCMTAKGWIRK